MSSPPLFEPIGDPIAISVANNHAHIWNVDDIRRLRVDHHICGVLTGTHPSYAQQNVFLSLPLQLIPEEVCTLVSCGIAYLVDDRRAHGPPALAHVAQFAEARRRDVEQKQREGWRLDRERKKRAKEVYKDKIAAAGAKKSRQGSAAVPAAGLASHIGEAEAAPGLLRDNGVESPALGPSRSGEHEPEPTSEELAATTYDIITATSTDPASSPWYAPSQHSYYSLEEAREVGLWSYPSTPLEKAKCEVFKAQWREGKFIGGGLRFGCDFLVYPGDTLRYHSHFACTVIPSPHTAISPLDLVSYGRLATAVKKAHLLACWDEEKGRVVFMSLEWAGMG